MTMIDTMIYVHIPFCDSKCFYCNFVSGIYKDDIKEKYFKKLNEEIEYHKNKNYNVTSIYIGGGTPSSVSTKYIGEILKNIFKNYFVSDNAEITIEANPCSLTKEKLQDYKKFNINRLSIGVQSLNNKCLKTIGRKHTKNQAISALKMAKSCGFKNINADVLIGIPKQNYAKLKSTVRILKKYVTHLSAYMLINEPNTKLTKMLENNEVKVVNEDTCVNYYNKLVKYLNKFNFKRYEISNFALKGFTCKHNLGYWQGNNYLGFGLSSHSYFNNERYQNSSVMAKYLDSDFEVEKHKLTKEEMIEEHIMLGLRTIYGVDTQYLKSIGYDILLSKKDEIALLEKNNFINVVKNRIVVNQDKWGVINQIILKLLP